MDVTEGAGTRPRGWTDTLAVVGGYFAAAAVFSLVGGVRGYDRPPELVLATFASALAIAVVSQVVSLRGRADRWTTGILVAFLVGLPLALFLVDLGVSALFDGATRWWPTKPGLRCLRLSGLDGFPILAGAVFARRRTEAVRPHVVGAVMGAAAGACAWVLTDLWCPVGNPVHLLIGHVAPLVALMALGAWPGGLVLRARGV